MNAANAPFGAFGSLGILVLTMKEREMFMDMIARCVSFGFAADFLDFTGVFFFEGGIWLLAEAVMRCGGTNVKKKAPLLRASARTVVPDPVVSLPNDRGNEPTARGCWTWMQANFSHIRPFRSDHTDL